jgi:hypothetical protein
VRRIGVRLSNDDVHALRQAQRIRIGHDHMNRTHADAAGVAAGAWWRAPAIAGLLIEGNRVEVVSFQHPGTFLVICAVQPHFVNDNMFGFVQVDDDQD